MAKRRTTSYSELSTLADCEMKWLLRYGGPEYVPSEPGVAMQKGTLVHTGVGALMKGLPAVEIVRLMEDEAEKMGVDLQTYEDAGWLVDRYRRHYSGLMANVTVEHAEKELKAKLPGTSVTIRGFVDELWIIDGKRWLVERKTMADWRRMNLVTVDPQVTLYYWLAQQNGLEPYGIVFDGIRTYRWALEKPTQKALIEAELAKVNEPGPHPGYTAPWNEYPWLEVDPSESKRRTAWARDAVERHPGVEKHGPSESFEQLWIDRTPEQVEAALEWARTIISRRTAIKRTKRAIRNIGPFCHTCSVKEDCFDGLAFPEPVIEIVED